jgi:hypothetical protein
MATRAGAALLGCILAVGLLVGCGGSDDSGDEKDSPETEPSTTATTEPTPSSYLPVPEGVTLTEPGTVLGFGDLASVAWRPRQDTVVTLDLTVDRIDKTSYKESFEGWVITEDMRGMVPYFVHATATNLSGIDIGSLLVPLYASDGTTMYEPLTFREDVFEPCPGGELPERLRPGKSADLCLVYQLPESLELAAMAFDLVGELASITWSGEITAIEKPKDKKDKKDRKGKNGDQDANGEGDQSG